MPQSGAAPHASYRSYVPESRDYGLELGGGFEERGVYWLVALLDFERRLLAWRRPLCSVCGSDCRRSGRDGLNLSLFHASLRSQYLPSPGPASLYWRALLGTMQVRGGGRNLWALSGGVGSGVRLSIQERLDLIIEARLGYADAPWGQGLVGVQLNMDGWMKYFGERMKALGEGTVETSGEILMRTLQAPVQVMDAVAPQVPAKSEPTPEETKSPSPN